MEDVKNNKTDKFQQKLTEYAAVTAAVVSICGVGIAACIWLGSLYSISSSNQVTITEIKADIRDLRKDINELNLNNSKVQSKLDTLLLRDKN